MKKETDRKTRLLGLLGLCRRAGKLVMGAELVSVAMAAKKKPLLVITSTGASANTQKKIKTKSEYYGIPMLDTDATPDELGTALGKCGSIAVIAVKDASFAKELIRIESTGKEPSITTEDRI